MKPNSIVPRHKDDGSRLKQANGPQILAAASELLEWLADINWPVSVAVGKALCPYVNQLKPALLPILRGNDGIWKGWCIVLLITHNDTVEWIDEEYLVELRRLVTSPTSSEQAEDVPEYAQDALDKWTK